VVGRESTFALPEVIRLISERFIPVAADDWYQRRRDDEVGRFFLSVAEQGPRKGVGGATRQGVYCFTASGKLLAYRNHHDAQVMLNEFRRAAERFDKLPPSEREPGAVHVSNLPDDKLDRRYTRKLPPDGMVVRVFARALERGPDGTFRACTAGAGRSRYGLLASQDHLWLAAEEWRSLAPADAVAGRTFDLPPRIAQRIARFHLIDNTRGEPAMWRPGEVRKCAMTLTVLAATAKEVKMRLDGAVLLATADDPKAGDGMSRRGYDARLLGYIDLDRVRPAVTRFDLVALGDHWGESRYTRGARPGRTPLGIVFQLADGKEAADGVPPQGAREWDEYFSPTTTGRRPGR
jgi:hypothetical protein